MAIFSYIKSNEILLCLSFLLHAILGLPLVVIYEHYIIKRNLNIVNSDYKITKEYQTNSYFDNLNYCYVRDKNNVVFFIAENKKIKISGVDGVCRKNVKIIQDGLRVINTYEFRSE